MAVLRVAVMVVMAAIVIVPVVVVLMRVVVVVSGRVAVVLPERVLVFVLVLEGAMVVRMGVARRPSSNQSTSAPPGLLPTELAESHGASGVSGTRRNMRQKARS